MDPLTVLGLMSNIVQLVDAATNAAKTCYEIYELGASIEDLQLAYTCDKLQNCYSTLNNSLASAQARQPLPCGTDLSDLSAECCQTAQILQKELQALQKSSGGGRREAVAKFLRKTRKAKEIQRLRESLTNYEKTLHSQVLIDTRQLAVALFSQQSSQSTNLDNKLAQIITDLAACHLPVADDLINAIKHEHEATREYFASHLDDTMQTLKIDQAQERDLQKQQDRLLDSLRLDDINLRQNDITQSNPKTFNWVFEDETIRAWDSLGDWLNHDRRVYWINGKPGAGKSTFMKFLTKDERTIQALENWSNNRDCIVLEFYFWLSGSKLQRSMKGFLCSLLRQIMLKNEAVLSHMICGDRSVIQKLSIGDWSVREVILRALNSKIRGTQSIVKRLLEMGILNVNLCTATEALYFAIERVDRVGNICLFLDGIDEFDQEEDVQQLLDLIERLAEFQHVKCCLSSRPEAYLEKRLSQYKKLKLQKLTAPDMRVCIEASLDTVFKKHAFNNTTRQQIDKLISLMIQKADGVFLWVHLAINSIVRGLRNEDDFEVLLKRLEELPREMNQLYQRMWLRLNEDEQRYREEASIYFSYHEFFPLSLFEMMIALEDQIQEEYLRDLKSQDPAILAQKCQTLKTRILTRCAGLIEVTGLDSNDLKQYHSTSTVTFLHRTARDFLLNTKAGKTIAGEVLLSDEERFSRLTKARMTTLLQGFEGFCLGAIRKILRSVAEFDTDDEICLLKQLHRVWRALSTPALGSSDASGSFELNPSGYDFTSQAASRGCVRYVQDVVGDEHEYVSAYYRGFLFLHAIRNLCQYRDTTSSGGAFGVILRKLQLARWLAHHGADLYTKQWNNWIETPSKNLIMEAIDLATSNCSPSNDTVMQTIQLIEKVSATCLKSTDIHILHIRLDPPMWNTCPSESGLVTIEIGVDQLCRYAMYCLGRWGIIPEKFRSLTLKGAASIKVRLIQRKSTEMEPIRLEEVQWEALSPNAQDSIDLGPAFERVLFSQSYSDPEGSMRALEDFSSRVQEVAHRCERVDVDEWDEGMDGLIDRDDNALVPDPSKDFDASNWQEAWGLKLATPTEEMPVTSEPAQMSEKEKD